MANQATINETTFSVGDTVSVNYKIIEKEKVTGVKKREEKEEVREKIFPQVKREVTKILNFHKDIPLPLKYGGFLNEIHLRLINADGAHALEHFRINMLGISYQYHSERILCRKKHLNRVIGILAHEYTHAVDIAIIVKLFQSYKLDESVFEEKRKGKQLSEEGTACGVEAKVTEILSSRFDKESSRTSVLYEGISLNVVRLLNAYLVLCQHAKLKPKEFAPFSVEKDHIKVRDIDKFYRTHPSYSLGTAFFALSELKHGPSVYARALRRDEGILQLH